MSKLRILVVDDEPNLSGLVARILEQTQRFEVRVENRSALALATAREYQPDLILLDVDMPGKDGGEVAVEIRAEKALSSVPILFLTSLVTSGEASERGSGQSGPRFLAKPVNPKVLIDTLDRLLPGGLRAA